MKHKLLLLLLMLCTVACQIDYDGETRFVVKTHVIDENGNPATKKTVQIFVSDNSMTDLIAFGNTDENGDATLIFPAPKNDAAQIGVSIGANSEGYLEASYSFPKSAFEHYQVEVQSTLYPVGSLTTFRLNKNHVNANTTLTALSLDAQAAVDYNDDNIFYINDFFIVKNQTITLGYTIRNNDTQQESSFSIPIVIENEPVTYNLDY